MKKAILLITTDKFFIFTKKGKPPELGGFPEEKRFEG